MANDNENLDKYINTLSDIQDEPASANPNVASDNEPDASSNAGDVNQNDGNINGNTGQADNQANEQLAQDKDAARDGTGKGEKASNKAGQQSQKGAQAANKDNLRPIGDGLFTNQKGDVVDDKGTVVAQSGFAARMYNTNKRLRSQMEEQAAQLSEVQRSSGELQSLSNSIKQYSLENTEVAQAIDLAGRMKRGDHIGVAKEVLAIIAAQGYNVTDLLGSDVGDTIELRAINKMIDQRLAPVTRQEQDRQQQEKAAIEGQRSYTRFVQQNEFADVHANDIVAVMKREGADPQQAYNRLYKFAVNNGLDFSQSLEPQIRAKMAQTQLNENAAHLRNAQRPMPNGQVTRMNGAMPSQPMSNSDDDWSTIIRTAQQISGS